MKKTDQELLEKRAEYNRLFKAQDYFYVRAACRANLSEAAFWILYSICESDTVWTQSALCKEWYYSKQTINSAVKKLEKLGFVELKLESGTGNRKVIVLTNQGHQYCEEEILPLIQAELDALAAFSEEERELLLLLMRRQLEALEERVKNSWK